MAVITASTTDAVNFDCVFEFRPHSILGSIYTCKPTVVLTESSTLEEVTGIHEFDHTLDDVESVWIQDQELPVFPKGIVNFFNNLKALLFWDAHILSISAEDLKPFPQLDYFFLFGNNFVSLDGDLFTHTPLLQFLQLGNNNIEHLGEGLMANLNNLQFLYLSNNICVDDFADNRPDVLELVSQLPALCPPLITTTKQTTTTATTTQTTTTQETSSPTTETTTAPITQTTTTTPETTKQQIEHCSCSAKSRGKMKRNKRKILSLTKFERSTDSRK